MALAIKSSVTRASSLRASRQQVNRPARSGVVCRADGAFLGSTTNIIMVTTTTLALASGRFGLAPTTSKNATAGLKLVDTNASGLVSGDPAGFTIVDVLAHGVIGHVLGVGIVLGLKGTGAL